MPEISLQFPDAELTKLNALMLDSARKAFQQAGEQQRFPAYMKKVECCKYLNVSTATLNGFIQRGLRVTTVGSIERYSKVEVDRFMNENLV